MEASNRFHQFLVSSLAAVIVFTTLVSISLMMLEWDGVLLFLFGK